MTESTELVPTPDQRPVSEAGSLAREMSRAMVEMAAYYERTGMSTSQAATFARALAEDTARVMETPSDQISWSTLGRLAEHDPETAEAAWQRIRAAAQEELVSGHRAAGAVEADATPWERARFLQVREAFLVDWQPRGGIEASMVETLAMAHVAQLHWMARLTVLSTTEARREDREIERRGAWESPTVGAAAAIDQAAAMVDRFNRLFSRTLRDLRDQRRHTPQVVVQHANQVNLAQAQMNVGQAEAPHDVLSGGIQPERATTPPADRPSGRGRPRRPRPDEGRLE
jgi:hypothetical protein